MPRPLPRAAAPAKAVAEPEVLRRGLQFLTGILGLSALGVAVNYKSIRGFKDEQEFAIAMRAEGMRPQPHRCNDRIEDFVQVWASSQGSILTQGAGSVRNVFSCLASKPGQEPSDPYCVLAPGERHYVDPMTRNQRHQTAKPQQQ